MDKKSITETKLIAESLFRHYTQIGSNLAKDIAILTKSFNAYINKHGTTQPEKAIPVNQFKGASLFLKTNKVLYIIVQHYIIVILILYIHTSKI